MNKIEKLREVNKQVQDMCDDLETRLFIQSENINVRMINEIIGDKTLMK